MATGEKASGRRATGESRVPVGSRELPAIVRSRTLAEDASHFPDSYYFLGTRGAAGAGLGAGRQAPLAPWLELVHPCKPQRGTQSFAWGASVCAAAGGGGPHTVHGPVSTSRKEGFEQLLRFASSSSPGTHQQLYFTSLDPYLGRKIQRDTAQSLQ